MALTDFTNVDAPYGIAELGSTFMTERARETWQLQTVDPLAMVLGEKIMPTKEIRVEWTVEELRLIGVVPAGKPNKMNTHGQAKSFTHQAANFRRGDFIDQDLINHLRAPGGDAMQEYGMELVDERLTLLIGQIALMMANLRTQMMTGGINYTDAETGYSVLAASAIPTSNYYTIGTTATVATSAHWTDLVNADVVSDFQTLLYQMQINARNKPTKCVMSTAMRQVISRGTKLRQFLPGNLSGLFATGLVQWGDDGLVTRIAGVDIIEHFMLMDDYVAGVITRQYMWPVNKVTFFAETNPSLPGQRVGYTVITKGENPKNTPGMYVRTYGAENLIDPTLPPGLAMQVGVAGLPVLYKPWWVHVVTACTVAEIKAVLGATYIP
jgi:hypothetical protein